MARRQSASRKHRAPQLSHRCNFESLESRRLLAVLDFQRFDWNGPDAPDMRVEHDLAVSIGQALGGLSANPPAVEGDGESIIRTGGNLTIQGEYELASATAHALAQIITPVGASVAVPVTTQVTGEITTSYALGGDASSHAVSDTMLIGGFEFTPEDADPEDEFVFTGFIHMLGIGVGSANGDVAWWNHEARMGITVFVDGAPVASVSARHFAHTTSDPPSGTTGSWLVTGFISDVAAPGTTIDINPELNTSGGVNLLLRFSSDIEPGQTVVFDSWNDVDEDGPYLPGIRSGDTLFSPEAYVDREEVVADSLTIEDAALARYNYGQAINAWGFVDRVGVAAPPPPLNQNLPLPGTVAGATIIDIDGDGDADDDDMRRMVEELQNWAAGSPSVAKEWTDALIDWSKGDAILVTTAEDELSDYSFNDLSLREALDLANNDPAHDTILIAPWVHNIDLSGNSLGALVIDSNVTIAGTGADKLTIDADGASRVFYVAGSGVLDVTISGMTITGGSAADGAGIYNASENLTLQGVRVTDNHTYTTTGVTGLGGGLFSANGSVTVIDSTFDGNTAKRGGAIRVQGFPAVTLNIYGSSLYDNESWFGEGALSAYSATSYIENTTISGNFAGQDSGGILVESSGQMTIINSTIVNNTATNYGGGLRKTGGTVTLHNTIVANNQNLSGWGPTQDLHGPLDLASSFNIFGAGSSLQSFTGAGNIIGTPTSRVNPQLAPLGDYGGKTKTHALLTNSPALDKGSNDWSIPYDQRGVGFVREHDMPTADGGDGYRDIGAFEAGSSVQLLVKDAGDRNDSVTSRNTIDTLRLREAFALANTIAAETIEVNFDSDLYSSGAATISLTYDGPDGGLIPDSLSPNKNTVVNGPGAGKLIITGNGVTAPIRVGNERTLTLKGVTITGGDGSGIYVDEGGSLTIDKVRVVANDRGITASTNANLTVLNSEISENSSGDGAGIYFGGGSQSDVTLRIINSTISDNVSSGNGGGLYVYVHDGYSTTVEIRSSTIAGNVAANGGGIYSEGDFGANSFILTHNSIISDNVDALNSADDIAGGLSSSSTYNLLGAGSLTGLSDGVAGNVIGHDAYLSSLLFFGDTRVRAPLWISPAIDAGDKSKAIDILHDQRGLERVTDWNIYDMDDDFLDIGAVELAFQESYS